VFSAQIHADIVGASWYDASVDIPNVITASRFLLAGAGAVALLFMPPEMGYPIALVIFIAAALSDWLDGVLARKLGRYSALGAFMDPLADKVIIYLYFAFLTVAGAYPVWLLMAFLARDLMHDGYRGYAASMRVSMPANSLSKTKTGLQMVAIISTLLFASRVTLYPWIENQNIFNDIGVICMMVALVFGILGAVKTLSDHKRFFLQGE
jgi:CDP-diacylglycerol--glycerol-3-phosphate 3-phosphatidyltransferase